jgi:branched-chain amino acid transport system ATP-binding protein
MTMLLSCRGLSVSFGGVHALVDVELDLAAGQLVGLIGPNGAGKTTLIDAVTGYVRSHGTVQLAGDDVSTLPPHKRARRGLARTWQAVELFDDLSVAHNLQVAAARPTVRSTAAAMLRGPRDAADPACERALALLGLAHLGDRMPEELSQGQRKLVGVARALAQSPLVVCLDEPAAGLDTAESEALGRRLRSVVDDGISLLLIDHDMGLVLSVCDYIVVLNFGRVIASGPPEQVCRDPRVVEAYLGASAKDFQGDLQSVVGGDA